MELYFRWFYTPLWRREWRLLFISVPPEDFSWSDLPSKDVCVYKYFLIMWKIGSQIMLMLTPAEVQRLFRLAVWHSTDIVHLMIT